MSIGSQEQGWGEKELKSEVREIVYQVREGGCKDTKEGGEVVTEVAD